MSGSGGVRNFGLGTLAFLHGQEAVLTVDQINDLINNAGQNAIAGLAGTVTGTGAPASVRGLAEAMGINEKVNVKGDQKASARSIN